jgi:hypothetical protein
VNPPVGPTFGLTISKDPDNFSGLTFDNPILIHDRQIDMQVHIDEFTIKNYQKMPFIHI